MLHVHSNITLHNHIRAKPLKKQNQRRKNRPNYDGNKNPKKIQNKSESFFDNIERFLLLFVSTIL